MTISPDARTTSADLHALPGTPQRGDARIMQPFGVATASAANAADTFVPLGGAALDVVVGLAARRAAADPDAEVIDLAERVQRLAAREDRVVTRTCRIEDAVFDAMRAHPRPELSEPMQRFISRRVTEADGTRVTTIREPAGWEAESTALREAHEAALAVLAQQEEREGARRNLPYWMKLRERAGNRLYRWILQLADTKPTTQAGLAAKAAAVNAIVEDDKLLPCDWQQELAASVSRDVVRLAAAHAGPVASTPDPFATFHAEIMALQATIEATEEGAPENEEAWKRWKQVDDRALASRPTTLAGALGALEYARREHHQFKVEDRQDMGLEVDRTDEIILHLLDGALGVLRPMAKKGAPSLANVVPASSASIEFPHGRYPAGTSREEIETYRTFLDMELRYLNHEIYGRTEGRMHLWLDNPAGHMHGPREPAASSRARAVLTLLGLMPTLGVDGRAQADGLARLDASAA